MRQKSYSKRRRFISKADKIFYKLERERLWIKQNKRCKYCNRILVQSEITLDHVIPIAYQPYHTYNNTVVACVSCNVNKGCKLNWDADDFSKRINEMHDRMEMRIRLAEYRLDINKNTKGMTFKKWNNFQSKKGKYPCKPQINKVK